MTTMTTEDAARARLEIDPGDSTEFRRVLGHVPTSVAVVTAVIRGEAVGLTVGSFTSVSLTPPLVTFFIDLKSKTWTKLNQADSFTVNVLGAEHRHICKAFSRPTADRFEGIDWTPSAAGNPVLLEATVALDCSRYKIDILGDHVQVVGRVQGMSLQNPNMPLVFYRGTFLDI